MLVHTPPPKKKGKFENVQTSCTLSLFTEAHSRGLSVGLKNDVDQIHSLVSHFDWALNEECVQYNECNKYQPFFDAGKVHVP